MKKPRKIIDNTRLFAQQEAPKKERLEEQARQKALQRAGEIYNDWQKHVIIQSRRMDELPTLVNELAWRLDREIDHADLKKNILDLVHRKLADVFSRIEMEKNLVRVLVSCPNMLPPDDETVTQAIKRCLYGGEVTVPRSVWETADIKFPCPQCNGPLTKTDMIDAKELPDAKKNRFIKATAEKKILPKHILTITSTEQLLELTYMKLIANRVGFERFAKDGRNIYAVFGGQAQRIGMIEFPELVTIQELTPSSAPTESAAASLPQTEPPTATPPSGTSTASPAA